MVAAAKRTCRRLCRRPDKRNSLLNLFPSLVYLLSGPDDLWRYTGGSTFLESIPATGCGYAELAFRLTEKCGSAAAIKYQLPGEPLDPDGLISVADDADVRALSVRCSLDPALAQLGAMLAFSAPAPAGAATTAFGLPRARVNMSADGAQFSFSLPLNHEFAREP